MRPAESVMRLHAIDHHNPVGLIRVLVHQHRKPIVERAQLHHVHRRMNLAPRALFGHAQPRQHLHLSIGSRASVASHRRNNKRLRTQPLQLLNRYAHNQGNLSDAAAAHPNGDVHPRLHASRNLRTPNLFAQRRSHVLHLGRRKSLPNLHHLRQRDIRQQISDHAHRFRRHSSSVLSKLRRAGPNAQPKTTRPHVCSLNSPQIFR